MANTTPTPKATAPATGGYAASAQIVGASGTTGTPTADAGALSASDYVKMYSDIKNGGQKRVIAALKESGQIPLKGKTLPLSIIQSRWEGVVGAAMTAGMSDPFLYLKGIAFQQGAASAAAAKQYSRFAGQTVTNKTSGIEGFWDPKTGKAAPPAIDALRKSLTDVLGHIPTDQEIQQYAPLLDRMRTLEQKGQFDSVQTTTYDASGLGRTKVKSQGENALTWLTTQVNNTYQQNVAKGVTPGESKNLEAYKQLVSNYALPNRGVYDQNGQLTQGARNDLSMLDSGKTTLADLELKLQKGALALYPTLKPQFDAGLSLKDVTDPAIQAISKILEVPASTIQTSDPRVQKYLQGADGKGNGTMPMYQYESMLKQDPSWQYTSNAHELFSNWAMELGQRFGAIG